MVKPGEKVSLCGQHRVEETGKKKGPVESVVQNSGQDTGANVDCCCQPKIFYLERAIVARIHAAAKASDHQER